MYCRLLILASLAPAAAAQTTALVPAAAAPGTTALVPAAVAPGSTVPPPPVYTPELNLTDICHQLVAIGVSVLDLNNADLTLLNMQTALDLPPANMMDPQLQAVLAHLNLKNFNLTNFLVSDANQPAAVALFAAQNINLTAVNVNDMCTVKLPSLPVKTISFSALNPSNLGVPPADLSQLTMPSTAPVTMPPTAATTVTASIVTAAPALYTSEKVTITSKGAAWAMPVLGTIASFSCIAVITSAIRHRRTMAAAATHEALTTDELEMGQPVEIALLE